MEDLFKDHEYCKKELITAIKLIGLKSTSIDSLENISKSLEFMYLYCPNNIQMNVLTTLNNIEKRILYKKTGVIT